MKIIFSISIDRNDLQNVFVKNNDYNQIQLLF